jgi:hypothetical protein
MKSSSISRACAVAAALTFLSHPSTTQACAMCMGGADSKNGPAINGAIFFMLGLLGLVFSGIIYVGYTFVRRARQPLPPHLELTQAFDPDGHDISPS